MHLADYMAENNLSGSKGDEYVAKKIRRSRPTVSRIRRKLVRPDWDTIERIRVFTKNAVTADDFAEAR